MAFECLLEFEKCLPKQHVFSMVLDHFLKVPHRAVKEQIAKWLVLKVQGDIDPK